MSETGHEQKSQREMRRQLLSQVPGWPRETSDDETQRALVEAYETVSGDGRGVEDRVLLLARSVVRLTSLLLETAERRRSDEALDRVDQSAEVAGLTASLANSREKVREMMRKLARVTAEQEQAIELMLKILENKEHRAIDHPEWVDELKKLSGATD
jgi:hypothetical protein